MPKFGNTPATRPQISTHEEAEYMRKAEQAHLATIVQTAIDDDGRIYRVNLNDPDDLPHVDFDDPAARVTISKEELLSVLNGFVESDSDSGALMALAIEPEDLYQ